MTVIEIQTGGPGLPPGGPGGPEGPGWRREPEDGGEGGRPSLSERGVVGALIDFATHFGGLTYSNEAPEGLSEHFRHASKRNPLEPPEDPRG